MALNLYRRHTFKCNCLLVWSAFMEKAETQGPVRNSSTNPIGIYAFILRQ